MDWVIDGIKFFVLSAVVVWVARGMIGRYRRCTHLDSNAPSGRVTDWEEFFSWKRRG
jgi:hypothetical protein